MPFFLTYSGPGGTPKCLKVVQQRWLQAILALMLCPLRYRLSEFPTVSRRDLLCPDVPLLSHGCHLGLHKAEGPQGNYCPGGAVCTEVVGKPLLQLLSGWRSLQWVPLWGGWVADPGPSLTLGQLCWPLTLCSLVQDHQPELSPAS